MPAKDYTTALEKPTEVAPLTHSFTITVKNDDRFKPVQCNMVMSSDYNLIFTFRGENEEYAITLYWKADVQRNIESKEPVYTYATPSTDGTYNAGSLTESHMLQVTATWDKENVTISRGEAINNDV